MTWILGEATWRWSLGNYSAGAAGSLIEGSLFDYAAQPYGIFFYMADPCGDPL